MSFGKRYVHVHGDKVGLMMTVRPGAGREVRPEMTLEVDLDIARPFNRSEHEHHERMYMYHYERTVETGRALGLTINRDAEVEGLRAKVRAMEAVVEAAVQWRTESGSLGRQVNDLRDAVDAYRADHPATASEAPDEPMPPVAAGWCIRVPGRECSDRHSQPTTATLTPEQWAVLFELRQGIANPTVRAWNFDNWTDEFRDTCIAAFDRLRSQSSNRNALDETDLRRLREAIANYDDYTGGAQRIVTLLRSLLDAGKLGGGQ